MRKIVKKLRVIPEPKPNTAAVLIPEVTPAFKGNGNTDYLWGNCNLILSEGAPIENVVNLVIKCPKCGNYNKV